MEKKDGGFTLIELLIALAVLSIMADVYKRQGQYFTYQQHFRQYCQAAEHGNRAVSYGRCPGGRGGPASCKKTLPL